MSLFTTVSSLVASKAAAAGIAVATATAGVATAAAVIPDEPETGETVVQQEEDLEGENDENLEDENLESEDLEGGGEEGPDEQGLENRSETANRVHEVISQRDTYESGRDFGAAVSAAARGDDVDSEGLESTEDDGEGDSTDDGDDDGDGTDDDGDDEGDDDGDDDNKGDEASSQGRATADEHRDGKGR